MSKCKCRGSCKSKLSSAGQEVVRERYAQEKENGKQETFEDIAKRVGEYLNRPEQVIEKPTKKEDD